eukprot:5096315-Alexandrium_andersonii.AAC.1
MLAESEAIDSSTLVSKTQGLMLWQCFKARTTKAWGTLHSVPGNKLAQHAHTHTACTQHMSMAK